MKTIKIQVANPLTRCFFVILLFFNGCVSKGKIRSVNEDFVSVLKCSNKDIKTFQQNAKRSNMKVNFFLLFGGRPGIYNSLLLRTEDSLAIIVDFRSQFIPKMKSKTQITFFSDEISHIKINRITVVDKNGEGFKVNPRLCIRRKIKTR